MYPVRVFESDTDPDYFELRKINEKEIPDGILVGDGKEQLIVQEGYITIDLKDDLKISDQICYANGQYRQLLPEYPAIGRVFEGSGVNTIMKVEL